MLKQKYVNEYFSLSLDSASRLQRMKPEFGYNGYGELVFYRTYSRLKNNGGQENWADVVTRVINGALSIRKDFYVRNFIYWDDEYWQAYGLRMAISLFNMHWLPGGRGLWAMGTSFIYERGSMALNNCFAGNTKFLNDDKVCCLKDCLGKVVTVTTTHGRKEATVKSFGVQSIYRVYLESKDKTWANLTYNCTKNHRWILSNGKHTTALKAGDTINAAVVLADSIVRAEAEYTVTKVLDLMYKEEVFCVVEPETHTFMLAGGIITGNCGYTELGGNDTLANDLNWMMDALMLGVGVGFKGVRTGLKRYNPTGTYIHEIPDTREGWAESVKLLVEAFVHPNTRKPVFDYAKLRGEGEPIKGFGGKASGPDPLIRLHLHIEKLFTMESVDEVRLKADLGNMLGVCVVAGNVRRSAELMVGDVDDEVFMNLKDYKKHPEREEWGWMSNNTAGLKKTRDFEKLGEVANRVSVRGEPGIANLRNFPFGRIGKPIPVRKDKARGLNPCGEVPLENKELCNVAETVPTQCNMVDEWYNACEYATMYCSSVSLLPTHREETNKIVARNRRIAIGIIDWTGWVQDQGLNKVTKYMRKGYAKVTKVNKHANAEAGVPEAIRKTTIKPGKVTSAL